MGNLVHEEVGHLRRRLAQLLEAPILAQVLRERVAQLNQVHDAHEFHRHSLNELRSQESLSSSPDRLRDVCYNRRQRYHVRLLTRL